MPKLKDSDYIYDHDYLRYLWLELKGVYIELSPNEQMLIHDYYRPSHEMSDEDLITHRHSISKARPGLPAQAGRILRKAWQLEQIVRYRIEHPRDLASGTKGSKRGKIVVKPLMRPEPDLQRIADALIMYIRDKSK